MSKLPEVRLSFSYLLHDTISKKIDSYENPDDSKLSTYEEAENYTEAYK